MNQSCAHVVFVAVGGGAAVATIAAAAVAGIHDSK